jgi:hypothetical protein
MQIYELRANLKRYCTFAVAGGAPQGFFHSFDGHSMTRDWKSLVIEPADEAPGTVSAPDFALLGLIPLVSSSAISVLAPLLSGNGELLPVSCALREYALLNVTCVVDALVEDASTIRRFSNGKVMAIDKFAFNGRRIKELNIFRIPQLPRATEFVSDRFVDTVNAAGLTGFRFDLVWNS